MNGSRSLFVLFVFAQIANGQVATGGNYTLEQSVIANGGNVASSFSRSVTGTTAQSAAGANSTGGSFSLHGGFWQRSALMPTAAMVSISGRVMMANRGLANIKVTLTDANGKVRSTITSTFGRYRFDDVEAGQTYILTVPPIKRFAFADSPRVLMVDDQLSEVNFVGVLTT